MKKVAKVAKVTKAQVKVEALVREAMFAAFKESTRKCMQKLDKPHDPRFVIDCGDHKISSRPEQELRDSYYTLVVSCHFYPKEDECYKLAYKVMLNYSVNNSERCASRTAFGHDEIVEYSLAYYSFDEIVKLITNKLIEIKADIC